jgi:hypothetical protein
MSLSGDAVNKSDVMKVLVLHGIKKDALYGKTNLLNEADVLRAMKEVSQYRAALRDIVESVSEEKP